MISLIIPVLNAEKYIEKLLEKIFSQTVVPDEIIILDSESEDRTIDICKKYDRVRVIDIKRKDFDHGGTRHI
ncbi:MAG: glycosyltransferase, partial [Ruminiclostridium sp.]|nr:glycosyltransferase [Ruminiclostridium sp.]